MATELLAVGSTAATSAPFTLAAGEEAHLILRPGPGMDTKSAIGIQVQGADNGWYKLGQLTPLENSRVVCAEGTYRLKRSEGVNAGADRA